MHTAGKLGDTLDVESGLCQMLRARCFDPVVTFVFNEVQSTVFANTTSPQKVQHGLSQSVNGDLVEIWDSSGPSLVALIYGKARYFLNIVIFAA